MADYTHTVRVDARADHVFGFVSQVDNLPKYLPTVQHASKQDGDRVTVDGQAHGYPYHNQGFFKVYKDRRALDWGADAQSDYSGHMEVFASGEYQSVVTCLVHITPRPPSLAMGSQSGRDAAIQEGLRTALEGIKSECESVRREMGAAVFD